MKKLDRYLSLMVAANTFMIFFLFVGNFEARGPSMVVVGDLSGKQSEEMIKLTICKQAFKGLQEGSASDFYLAPDLIEKSRSEDDILGIKKAESFYHKMVERNLCRVIAKFRDGFRAYDVYIGEDGPLLYRVSSIISKTPKISEVEEHL